MRRENYIERVGGGEGEGERTVVWVGSNGMCKISSYESRARVQYIYAYYARNTVFYLNVV